MSTEIGSEPVLYEASNQVAVVTLNRPDRLNAWNRDMSAAYAAALDRAEADPDVRAIVLTGAGRGFCAGADLEVLQEIGAGARVVGEDARSYPPRLAAIPKPVIGAINGACAGLGFVIALMCDVRFAAAGAKFTSAFSRRGLIAEYGSSWLLPRLVGPAAALDVLLSARVLVAEEAERIGLVNRVVPPDQVVSEAIAYARDLAENCSPSAMAAIKRQVWSDLERSLPDATTEAIRLMEESSQGEDFKEGVASFVEQRPPRFAPLRG